MSLRSSDLSNIVARFRDRKVLVIGDLMLDRYLIGNVTRVSPEAPVPVVLIERETHVPGGAANVALNVAALSASCDSHGAVGKDSDGELLINLLQKQKVGTSSVRIEQSARTTVKTRVVAMTQQICRIDHEKIAEANANSISPSLENAIDQAEAVIFSDYAKGAITQSLYNQVVERCRNTKKLISIDPKPTRPMSWHDAYLITPNLLEAYQLARIPAPHNGLANLPEVAKIIHDQYNPKLLIITLGAAGMAICVEGKISKILPTVAKEVFDVSGAGDAVIATLTLALLSGADAESAATLANLAASVVVSKLGTTSISLSELLAQVESL